MKMLPAVLAAAFVALMAAAPAGAAGPESPRYVTSDPGDGAESASAPSRVTVTFSEPLDSSSTLRVYDECGRAVDAGDTQVLGSRMDVGIAETPSGHYTAVYDAKAFGGATGETKDDFSFHVTSGDPCGGGAAHHHHEGGGSDHEGHEGGGHSGHGGHSGGTGHDGHEGHSGTHTGHSAHDTHAGHSAGHDAHGATHEGHSAGHGSDGAHGADHHDHGAGLAGVHDLNGKDERGLVQPPLAAGAGGSGLAPTGQSVLIALALSMVMGTLGGLVLRASASS